MIADELFVSRETVKTHVKNIYAKLHVSCAARAAKTLQQKLLGVNSFYLIFF